MNKFVLVLMGFIMSFGIVLAPSFAQAYFQNVYINTTGGSGVLTNMPFIVNGSLGVNNLNGTCSSNLLFWNVANVSGSNTTFNRINYDSCSNPSFFNGTNNYQLPFEQENGTIAFNPLAVWSPRNYSIVAHFGNFSGTAYDSSIYGNAGSLTGAGIVYNNTVPIYGNFITHQGAADQYVDFGDTASIVKGNTFTALIWFRPDKSGGGATYQALFDKGTNTGTDQFFVRINPSDQLEFAISGVTVATSGTLVNIGQWNFAVFQYDGTNGKGWLNGKFVGSTAQAMTIVTTHLKVGGDTAVSGQGTFLGSIDEFRLTSTVLSTDEINQTYLEGKTRLSNLGGQQLTAPPQSYYSTNISQNTPILETNSTMFAITINVSDLTVKNVTAHLNWNGTNESFDTYANDTIGNFTFTKNLTIPVLVGSTGQNINTYWNFTISFINGTLMNIGTATVGQTVNWAYNLLSLSSIQNNQIEGNNVSFTASSSTSLTTATLNSIFYLWNTSSDMQKPGTTTSYGNFANWFQISPPSTPTGFDFINSSLNVSYNGLWVLRNTSGTSFSTYRIIVSGCNATYSQTSMILYNFAEGNQTAFKLPDNVTIAATIDAYNGPSTRQYAINLTSNATLYTICLSPSWSSFQANATILYGSPGYTTRSYYLFNATIDNTTRSVNLYLLPTQDSNLLTFTVRDSSSQLLPNAYIFIQRYYPDTNSYQTVEVVKTDANGQAPSYITLYSVFYKFLILLGGVTKLDTSAALQSNANIQFIVDTGTGGVQYYTVNNGLTKSCVFDNSTRYLTCSYTDSSGYLTQGCLDVRSITPLKTTLSNSSCISSASGSLAFFIPQDNTTHNYQFYGTYSLTPTQLQVWITGTADAPIAQPFGTEGVFIAMILFLTTIGIGLKDPRVAIIMTIVALIISFAFGLLAIGVASIVSLVAVGMVIIWRSRTQ